MDNCGLYFTSRTIPSCNQTRLAFKHSRNGSLKPRKSLVKGKITAMLGYWRVSRITVNTSPESDSSLFTLVKHVKPKFIILICCGGWTSMTTSQFGVTRRAPGFWPMKQLTLFHMLFALKHLRNGFKLQFKPSQSWSLPRFKPPANGYRWIYNWYIYISFYLCIHVYLSIYLSIDRSIYLSIYLYTIYLFKYTVYIYWHKPNRRKFRS